MAFVLLGGFAIDYGFGVFEAHRPGKPILALPFSLIPQCSLMHVIVDKSLFVFIDSIFIYEIVKQITFFLVGYVLKVGFTSVIPSPLAIPKRYR